MSADARRELVLAAAVKAFATGGYHGTSTDTVARAAGVSQPYVVRIFGSKLELFTEALKMSCDRIDAVFSELLDDPDFDPASEEDRGRLGLGYADLLADQDLLRVMMHGFAAGNVPEIGEVARDGMSQIFSTLRRTGWSEEEIRDFIAQGMLLNVLLSMGALSAGMDSALGDLVRACLPDAMTVGL